MQRLGATIALAAGLLAVLAAAPAMAVEARSKGVETAALPAGIALDDQRLPAVLSSDDVRLYKRIFELGEPGRWDEVDRLVAQLDNKVLLGHVLAQRYLHPTKYRTPFHELRDWLAAYHDHPQAKRLYTLAQRRRPSGAPAVHRPTYRRADLSTLGGPPRASRYMTLRPRSAGDRRAASRILRQVRWNVLRTRLTVTERMLAGDKARSALNAAEMDGAYARVAAGWYYYGNDDKAQDLAAQAAARSGDTVPMAYWTAGLAAWRRDDLKAAARHFGALAEAERISDWNAAAGAYWAARAHLRLRQPAEMSRWLRRAAAHPRTFYGQLAHQALGTSAPLAFDDAGLEGQGLETLKRIPAGRRAIALLQVGLRERARRELLGIDGWRDPAVAAALLVAAERGGLSALVYRLGSRMANDPDSPWPQAAVNAALYPIPPWQPATGFRVDRALIYAMMRQESGFNPDATSSDGARGLMQLMPATASYMARRNNFRYSRRALYRPDLNLDLAQRYVAYLLDNDAVAGDLFNLAAAYNGGPGNLAKWRRKTEYKADPLLFIESLPSRETRLFIERVLTNLWIYRQRLGQPAPSRAAIAAGDWPRYESLDGQSREVASK